MYGYMRVSTTKRDDDGEFVQSFTIQHTALLGAGVREENIFRDRISGAKAKRPGLDALLSVVKSGDVILVWKLDRLGRNARHLLEIAEQMKERGVTIRSLVDGLDTSGKFGGFLLTMLAAVAELERENISERVTAGMSAARRSGVRLGRKNKLSPSARQDVIDSIASGKSVSEIARRYRVNRSTIYEMLKKAS